MPFDSGHVLALRVFPQNDFSPYRAVWHRDPDHRWSIHVDGPRLDTACPRYFGPACHVTGYARIGLTWTGPASLRVSMDSPALEWTLTATSTRILALLNTMGAAMPLATWRRRSLVRARERLASALGMGRLRLTGTMPSGHTGTLMPEQMYFIDDARATLDGADLGRPARLRENPAIGGVSLPARGVLATGQAVFEILDPAEYQRTRYQAAASIDNRGSPHADHDHSGTNNAHEPTVRDTLTTSGGKLLRMPRIVDLRSQRIGAALNNQHVAGKDRNG